MAELTEAQYRVLLVFRSALRRYLQWSAETASGFGLSPQQHQLLLALRARSWGIPLCIGEISEELLIRHHSAVELCTRAETAGWVERHIDASDHRIVRLRLTSAGRQIIDELSESHLAELERVSDRIGISEEFLQHLSEEFAQHLLEGLHPNGL